MEEDGWKEYASDPELEKLWNEEESKAALKSLVDQLGRAQERQQHLLRKQLFYTRLLALAGIAIAVITLAFVLTILPGVTGVLEQASETLLLVDQTLEDFGQMSQNVDALAESGGEAIEQLMGKVEQMDIEGLNDAISDLNDVIKPLADFFGNFR